MCNVNISESIKSILDNEIDVTIDDGAWLYESDADSRYSSDTIKQKQSDDGWTT